MVGNETFCGVLVFIFVIKLVVTDEKIKIMRRRSGPLYLRVKRGGYQG